MKKIDKNYLCLFHWKNYFFHIYSVILFLLKKDIDHIYL